MVCGHTRRSTTASALASLSQPVWRVGWRGVAGEAYAEDKSCVAGLAYVEDKSCVAGVADADDESCVAGVADEEQP